MSIAVFRQVEINKLIESIFEQFDITSDSERALVRANLKQQLKSAGPLQKYESATKANSRKYRADVRAFMIDSIAQLLALKEASNQVNELEATSRDMITFAQQKVDTIEREAKDRASSGSVIYESFDEQSFTGVHNGTTVKDGSLRIATKGTQRNIKPKSVSIETLPFTSEQVNTLTDGEPMSIFSTGLGSDSYWTVLSTQQTPSIEYIGDQGSPEVLTGLVSTIIVEYAYGIKPAIISAKFATPSRIYRVFVKDNTEDSWEALIDSENLMIEDRTEGTFSYIDGIKAAATYKFFKIIINTPRYVQEKESLKYYKFGIHNLKIEERQNNNSIQGTFESNKYESNAHIFKTTLSTKEREFGFSNYKVNFNIGNLKQSMAISPTTYIQTEVKMQFKINENSFVSFLPFPNESFATPHLYYSTDSSTKVLEYETPKESSYIFYKIELNGNGSGRVIGYLTPEESEWSIQHDVPKILRCSESLVTEIQGKEDLKMEILTFNKYYE